MICREVDERPVQVRHSAPELQAVEEAREVKCCIQGDGLAVADEKAKRGSCLTSNHAQRTPPISTEKVEGWETEERGQILHRENL